MPPSITPALVAFVAAQRWYTGKGTTPALTAVGHLPVSERPVVVESWLLRDDAGPEPVLYQLPVTLRAEPEPSLAAALVAPGGGDAPWVYDGCQDPAGALALLDVITTERATGDARPAGPPEAGPGSVSARVHRASGPVRLSVRSSRVLRGEQSNTSIIYDARRDGAEHPVILKVFRVLHPGRNPDVEVQQALAAAGSTRVPRPLGDVLGRWPQGESTVEGHLALAQEFLPGVEDAWRVALDALRAGEDFTARAHSLGAATAEVHATLAQALPTVAAGAEHRQVALQQWRRRYTEACRAVPALTGWAAEVDAVLLAGAQAPWPRLQRVHGDYHLGQVIDAPGRGWVLLDFEGEPLRPLAERSVPDLPERDVAGMLRSFDYAAASVPGARPGWAARMREAFLDGYAEVAGQDPRRTGPALLRALELDKALYEAVYEARNRPDWLPIPLSGVEHVLAAARGGPLGTHEREADGTVSTMDSSAQTSGAPSTSPRAGGPDRAGRPAASAGRDQPGRPGQVGRPDQASRPDQVGRPDQAAAEAAGPRRGGGVPSAASAAPATRATERAAVPVDREVLHAVAYGSYHDPHSVLGAHAGPDGITVRTVRHLADAVTIVTAGGTFPARHEYEGVWVAVLPGTTVPDYRVRVTYGSMTTTVDDPYRFLPTLGELDQHLLREGRHEELWRVLGAHVRRFPSELGEVQGVSFAVWAPNARAVRVVGDFNSWTGAGTAMRSLGASGVWELFVPGIGAGERYKFEIGYRDGSWHQKADPMARATEVPPATASVVAESTYTWQDEAWLERRAQTNPHTGPMSIYEVHLASWRPGLTYRDLAEQLIAYVQDLGFTHVELMPVAEHPFGGSWGYQVTSYYAPTSRMGGPDDFRYLVDRLHQAGIGVIMDWVPAHFPKDAWALARFDGTALYEHADPMLGDHPDWGTHIFDFGRREVRNFLVANALYWLEEFHIDGLRVDAVASMLYLDYSREPGQWRPNARGGRENLEAISFLQETTATAYRKVPGIVMIAEESTAWPGVTAPTSAGGLGFGLKWNMGWMNDTLRYLAEEPINRRYHHGELTFSLVYAFSEQFVLPLSHDEVVHGKGSLLSKMPGDYWQQLAGVRSLLAYQWCHPGKQLLFMGQEFAQGGEWDESRGLDWWHMDVPEHQGVAALVRDLNRVYRDHPALWSEDFSNRGFEWIEVADGDHNVISFIRRSHDGGDVMVCVVNFAGTPHEGYRVGLPSGGRWLEVLNTDAAEYGGSGVGNMGSVQAEEVPWNGRAVSAPLRVPPLGALWLAPAPATD